MATPTTVAVKILCGIGPIVVEPIEVAVGVIDVVTKISIETNL